MTGTRLFATLLAVMMIATALDASNWFSRKGKSDARVRQLAESLRTEPDEKKRRSAVAELREADPQTQADVIPALIATLRRDPAAAVRADAAVAIGSFPVVFPFAGAALEAAAETDPSPAVRDWALQALWEYHISGYRSTKGADGIAGQTVEPPFARPAQRPAGNASAIAAIQQVSVAARDGSPDVPPLPAIIELPGSVLFDPSAMAVTPVLVPRVVFTSAPPLQLNVTAEPPRATPAPVAPRSTSGPLPPPDLELHRFRKLLHAPGTSRTAPE